MPIKIADLATLAVLGNNAAALQKRIDGLSNGDGDEPAGGYGSDVASILAARQNPYGYNSLAHRKAVGLFSKIAAGPTSGMSLGSVAGPARSVGSFGGSITSKMMRPPGLDTMRIAVNPRRNIRQAMTAFTA